MRIGLVVPGFSADAADWCIPALRNLVQRLATTDDVAVFALRYPRRAGEYDVFAARVTALGGGQRRGLGSGEVWRRTLAALARAHRHQPFDVLHSFWATEAGAVTTLAGRLLHVPTVVSLAGGELVGLRDLGYGGQLVWTERLKIGTALRLADAVTAGSRYLLDLARPWLGSRQVTRIHQVPLGVDLRTFQPAARTSSDRPPTLVQVASLVPVKDQTTLLQGVAHLRDRGLSVALEIAGVGPLEPGLRSLAAILDISQSVRFLGEVPHDRLPLLYQRGDLLVSSSRHEAQGMAILEAAACGLPVVGTAVGVVPELAPDAALSVPPRDPQALADAIAEVMGDPDRRDALGRAARTRVEAEFGLELNTGQFRQIYSELVR